MAEYINPPLETDPDVLADGAFDKMREFIPGWEPANANVEALLIESISPMAAETRDVASAVPLTIFQFLGSALLGLPPVSAAPATVTSTWTMRDNLGYTIPDGTVVGIRSATGVRYAFQTAGEVVVPAGSVATAAGGVLLVAVDPGTAQNGLSGGAQLFDALDYVTAIALVGTPTGGSDAENEDEYTNRLVSEFTLLTPRPIVPNDFAVLARRVAGVFRATAIDGYNPAGGTYNNERMVAIAALDEAGAAVSAPVKSAIDAYLQSLREVNFIVNVIDPTLTTINVTFTAVALAGFAAATVEADAEAAVTAYLSAANWGHKTGSDSNEWVNDTVVRYLEVAEAINRVNGIDYITALTVNGGTANVNLAGAAALPQPGAIAGTVT